VIDVMRTAQWLWVIERIFGDKGNVLQTGFSIMLFEKLEAQLLSSTSGVVAH
jgi:hypothetical protein